MDAGDLPDKKTPDPADAASRKASRQTGPEAADATPRKHVELPSEQPGAAPYPFATHAPPPPEQDAGARAASQPGRQKEYSTGFILGVLIIAVGLAAGIAIVRLQKQARRLERRIQTLENARPSLPWRTGR